MAKCVMLKSGGGVTDVTVGGKSVVADGVAAVPVAGNKNFGVITFEPNSGIQTVYGTGRILIEKASSRYIKERGSNYTPIVPGNLDEATKAAMCDGIGPAWTDTERQAALARMGCTVGDDGVVKFTAQKT